MIEYVCRTNLDEAKGKIWPRTFADRPIVGDYVRAMDGYKLKVVSVTHCVRQRPMTREEVPYIEVELNR